MPPTDACFHVSWDDATGLARIDWSPGTVCGLTEALAVDRDVEALGQGPVRCLVNLREVNSIDRPAREFFIHSPRYAAVALLADSATTRDAFVAKPVVLDVLRETLTLWARASPTVP